MLSVPSWLLRTTFSFVAVCVSGIRSSAAYLSKKVLKRKRDIDQRASTPQLKRTESALGYKIGTTDKEKSELGKINGVKGGT